VYALRFREGLPWAEVAETMKMPERTARWHGNQIRERLRVALRTWNEAG
jgi:DNA-directed RNA polymerase specialized sigma24 family protein